MRCVIRQTVRTYRNHRCRASREPALRRGQLGVGHALVAGVLAAVLDSAAAGVQNLPVGKQGRRSGGVGVDHRAYFAALVPDHLQGRVQSIATLLSLGPIPFGVLLVGVSLEWIGSTATVWSIFALMLLASIIALGSKEIRDVPPLHELAGNSGRRTLCGSAT
jgi:VIT1/CCC1 family predicted Fe2+/Mn2+ transporter